MDIKKGYIMQNLLILAIGVLFVLASTSDFEDAIGLQEHIAPALYTPSNESQGYETAFFHDGRLIVDCTTDLDCEIKNPHLNYKPIK